MQEPQFILEEKVNPIILKGYFSSRTDPSIFTTAPVFLASQTKLNEFIQHLNQQATSYPSAQCLVDEIQVQKPILVVATDQMPDHI